MTHRSLLTALSRICLFVAAAFAIAMTWSVIHNVAPMPPFPWFRLYFCFFFSFFCYHISFFFQSFRIICRHQQHVQANQSPQNFGQQAIIVKRICSMFLFLSPSFNPLVYIWGLNYIRNSVKVFLRKMLCTKSSHE